MTVGLMRELLENFEDDVEVRLATQPSWPLAFRVAGIVDSKDVNEFADPDEYDPDNVDEENDPGAEICWIVEGGHPNQPESPYAPRWVFDAV